MDGPPTPLRGGTQWEEEDEERSEVFVHLLFELAHDGNTSTRPWLEEEGEEEEEKVDAFIELSSCQGPKGKRARSHKAKLTCVPSPRRGGCHAVTHWTAAFERSRLEEGRGDRDEEGLGARMQLVWQVRSTVDGAPRRHVHALRLPHDVDPRHADLFGLVVVPSPPAALTTTTKDEHTGEERDRRDNWDQKEGTTLEEEKGGAQHKRQDSKREKGFSLGSITSTLLSLASFSSPASSTESPSLKEKPRRVSMVTLEDPHQCLAGFLAAIWDLQENGALSTDRLSAMLSALFSFAKEQLGLDEDAIRSAVIEFIALRLSQATTPENECKCQGRI